jgi:hypothetical protein
VGVLVAEGVLVGCKRRPNKKLTRRPAEGGAYEVCEMNRGGRLESSPESDMFPSYTPTCIGSATACLKGLNVDMLEARVGWWSESLGVGGTALLLVGGCLSAFSSTTSRTKPSTRLTMFPTTISRGCADVKSLPT